MMLSFFCQGQDREVSAFPMSPITNGALLGDRLTRLSTRSVLDAKVGFRQGNWSVYAWGTNLLDDFYETGVTNISMFVSAPGRAAWVNTPRRLGVGVEATW